MERNPIANNQLTRKLARLAGIMPEDVIFIAGSTQDPEEQMALDVYQLLKKDFPALRLILVPRHPETIRPSGTIIGSFPALLATTQSIVQVG